MVALVSEYGRFDVVAGAREFAAHKGDAVSVFALRPGTHVVSEGLEWPLDGVALDELWKGTLNRAIGSSFRLSANMPILVYRNI